MNRRSFLKFLVGAPAVALLPVPKLEQLDEVVAPVADPLAGVAEGPWTLSAWARPVGSKIWVRVFKTFDEEVGHLMAGRNAGSPLVLRPIQAMATSALMNPVFTRPTVRTRSDDECPPGIGVARIHSVSADLQVCNVSLVHQGPNFLAVFPRLPPVMPRVANEQPAHNLVRWS